MAQARSKEQVKIQQLEIPETLKVALEQVKEIFDLIKSTEEKQEIKNEIEPVFLLVKPMYEWAKGRDFVEISELTEVLEGAIIRTIQRIEQTLRNIKRALTVIGNETQLLKVEKASQVIKRDIAFALSLYIDENKEFAV